MHADSKLLMWLLETLLEDESDKVLAFERVARMYADRKGVTMREALGLMDRRWRTMLRRARRNDHRVLTTTTWYGVKLGLAGIAALTDDREIKRCVPGFGNGNKAEAFVLAKTDDHILFIAEQERVGNVVGGILRTQYGQLADATVQGVITEDEARGRLTTQPKRLTLADLKRLGQNESRAAS